MESKDRIEAVSGKGLRGDRYFNGIGTYSQSARDVSRELSLIEGETLDSVERDYGISISPDEHRRNLTTRDIGLNRLVGKRFRVGDATCEGVEFCEPCSYLESLLEREGIHDALVHRGGTVPKSFQTGSSKPALRSTFWETPRTQRARGSKISSHKESLRDRLDIAKWLLSTE